MPTPPGDTDDGDSSSRSKVGGSDVIAPALIAASDKLDSPLETTEDHVEAIRAELAARGVPKSPEALEAVLVIDAEIMSRTEFEVALEVVLDRGGVERVGDELVPST